MLTHAHPPDDIPDVTSPLDPGRSGEARGTAARYRFTRTHSIGERRPPPPYQATHAATKDNNILPTHTGGPADPPSAPTRAQVKSPNNNQTQQCRKAHCQNTALAHGRDCRNSDPSSASATPLRPSPAHPATGTLAKGQTIALQPPPTDARPGQSCSQTAGTPTHAPNAGGYVPQHKTPRRNVSPSPQRKPSPPERAAVRAARPTRQHAATHGSMPPTPPHPAPTATRIVGTAGPAGATATPAPTPATAPPAVRRPVLERKTKPANMRTLVLIIYAVPTRAATPPPPALLQRSAVMENNNQFDALMADDDNGNQTAVQQPPSAAQAANTNSAGPSADATATPERFAAVNFAAPETTPPAAATAARFAPVNFGGQGEAQALEIYQTASNCPVLLNYQAVTPYQLDDAKVLEQAAAHGLEGAQFAEIDLLGLLMTKLTKEEAHLALQAAQHTERTGQQHEPPPHSIASLYRLVMDTPSYSIVARTSGPQSNALKQWAKGPLHLPGPNGKVIYANPAAPEAGNPVNIYTVQVLNVENRHLGELITAIQQHLNS